MDRLIHELIEFDKKMKRKNKISSYLPKIEFTFINRRTLFIKFFLNRPAKNKINIYLQV